LSDGALFYGVIVASLLAAGSIVLIPSAPLFALAIGANVAATIFMAPTLVFLLLIARDRRIMGTLANGPVANLACSAVTAIVCALSSAYGAVTLANLRL
jgi:hypothetical protein